MARRGAAIATLRLLDVGVHAGGRPTLRDVSLEVADGSMCAVIGPSGAGKTTLLRAAAGLVAHSGSVLLDGRDVSAVAPHRRGIAMLFQDPRLFDSMSVVDNVAYAARVRSVPRRRRGGEARALLDEVGLGDRADDRTAELSGGERQRVALARALTADPHVLLLDEPLAALDPPRRVEIRAVIDRTRRARSLTTVYVSHDLADAVDGADRLAVVVDGAIAQHDTPTAVLERPTTAEVARLTGNPNVLVDGSTVFTVRPEHVELDDVGLPATVTAVERRITHDLVRLDSPWGVLHAIVAPGRAPVVGARTAVTLPDRRRWRFPRAGASAQIRSTP
jgi:putative spermidine/putrescine transport system ATP-binding protein